MSMRRVHLCTGILERDGALLLVANRYPNRSELLWNLPGGRQDGAESLAAAVQREFREETSLRARVGGLAYIAESVDSATRTHFTNFAFAVEADGEVTVPSHDAHVVACAWVARASLAERLAVRVVREPLLAYLADPGRRYFELGEAGITIEFAD
jgi:ADP-ribose pyrophosphatase YjhB (NUDIX family)